MTKDRSHWPWPLVIMISIVGGVIALGTTLTLIYSSR